MDVEEIFKGFEWH